jgi:ferredoxin
MIVAEHKPFEELQRMVAPYPRLLVVGCGTCVTVCFAGGTKEVGILASMLRMASQLNGADKQINEATIQRQCEWEYLDALKDQIGQVDAVLSLGCGVGVQAIAEHFPEMRVLPGLNTSFLGLPEQHGVWVERCAACGDCLLDKTGGICPIARCAKQLLNGPCGGSQNGKCEIGGDTACAWALIIERMTRLSMLDQLLDIKPPKNWSTARDGGPRRIAREDLMLMDQ